MILTSKFQQSTISFHFSSHLTYLLSKYRFRLLGSKSLASNILSPQKHSFLRFRGSLDLSQLDPFPAAAPRDIRPQPTSFLTQTVAGIWIFDTALNAGSASTNMLRYREAGTMGTRNPRLQRAIRRAGAMVGGYINFYNLIEGGMLDMQGITSLFLSRSISMSVALTFLSIFLQRGISEKKYLSYFFPFHISQDPKPLFKHAYATVTYIGDDGV